MEEHTEKQKALHRVVYTDWGLYDFIQMLAYKCLLAGKALVQIDERDTSKTCSGCGHQQDMLLWKRVYRCENCGLVMDRDENSAVNQLRRFLARPGPHIRRKWVQCAAGDQGGVAVTGTAQAGQAQKSIRLYTF